MVSTTVVVVSQEDVELGLCLSIHLGLEPGELSIVGRPEWKQRTQRGVTTLLAAVLAPEE